VISQVILRRFAGPIPSGGRQLAYFDLGAGQATLADAEDVGYVENFVPVDSQATEDLWQTVETRLRPAIKAALGGAAIGNPVHVSTLQQAVALHYVRNPQTLIVHNQSYADALQNGIDRMAKSPHAAHAFRQKYNIAAAAPGALRLGAEAIYGRLIKLHEEGGLFRLSVQRLFEKVCDRFDAKGVQILTRPVGTRSSCSATFRPSRSTERQAKLALASPSTRPMRSSCPSLPGSWSPLVCLTARAHSPTMRWTGTTPCKSGWPASTSSTGRPPPSRQRPSRAGAPDKRSALSLAAAQIVSGGVGIGQLPETVG
jgi:hypothetical protein